MKPGTKTKRKHIVRKVIKTNIKKINYGRNNNKKDKINRFNLFFSTIPTKKLIFI